MNARLLSALSLAFLGIAIGPVLAQGPNKLSRLHEAPISESASGDGDEGEGFGTDSETGNADPWRMLQSTDRGIPAATGHPGNVFLQGDVVAVRLPEEVRSSATAWQAVDDRGVTVARGNISGQSPESLPVAKLGIGWYRIELLDSSGNRFGWTTAAVLAPLAAPVPQDSPVCVDTATAWFARDDRAKQEHFSRLASLCGVNWTRDRIRWRDMQPAPDQLATDTTYDSAAEIQNRHGLKVLQVFHDTPPWAVTEGGGTGRFPGDLRTAYRFGKAMSKRFTGEVQAWEPWNEANISNFGGHTIDAICSYQKAAYLGFKAGDPHVTVCWNVTTGVPTRRQTVGVLANETWPYFDTYNVHTYDWPSAYERLWGTVREAACGKPIWVTESDRGSPVDEDSPTRDMSPQHERLKAEFIAQSYASSLHAGANRHFHFILGQYGERDIQFGLLRHDLTPRPSYVALAAVGRFLAGARCLGRHVVPGKPDVHVIAFDSRPDGKRRDVLVAWAEPEGEWSTRGSCQSDWPLADAVTAVASFDYLGRSISSGAPTKLKSAPSFVILPSGESSKLQLESPGRSPVRRGAPSAVVLQCLMPKHATMRNESIRWAGEYEYQIAPDQEFDVPLFIYNFADHEINGTVTLEHTPEGCKITPDRWSISLAPMRRQQLPARVRISANEKNGATSNAKDDSSEKAWIRLRGDFDDDGQPVLAFQLFASPS